MENKNSSSQMYWGELPASEQEAITDTSFLYSRSVLAPSLWEIGLHACLKDLCVSLCA